MDLSKIPDLELRQKIKPLNDAIDKIDKRITELKEPLLKERAQLREQLNALLDDREIAGTCDVTGLPVFHGDEIVEKYVLACVA